MVYWLGSVNFITFVVSIQTYTRKSAARLIKEIKKMNFHILYLCLSSLATLALVASKTVVCTIGNKPCNAVQQKNFEDAIRAWVKFKEDGGGDKFGNLNILHVATYTI